GGGGAQPPAVQPARSPTPLVDPPLPVPAPPVPPLPVPPLPVPPVEPVAPPDPAAAPLGALGSLPAARASEKCDWSRFWFNCCVMAGLIGMKPDGPIENARSPAWKSRQLEVPRVQPVVAPETVLWTHWPFR